MLSQPLETLSAPAELRETRICVAVFSLEFTLESCALSGSHRKFGVMEHETISTNSRGTLLLLKTVNVDRGGGALWSTTSGDAVVDHKGATVCPDNGPL